MVKMKKKCTFCNEFYGYYLFDNLCSECLFKNNSEKYLELFSKKYLDRIPILFI